MKLEANRGTTLCNLTVYVTRDGATQLLLIGGYRTELRKIDGEWYFVNVTPFVDTKTAGPADASAVRIARTGLSKHF